MAKQNPPPKRNAFGEKHAAPFGEKRRGTPKVVRQAAPSSSPRGAPRAILKKAVRVLCFFLFGGKRRFRPLPVLFCVRLIFRSHVGKYRSTADGECYVLTPYSTLLLLVRVIYHIVRYARRTRIICSYAYTTAVLLLYSAVLPLFHVFILLCAVVCFTPRARGGANPISTKKNATPSLLPPSWPAVPRPSPYMHAYAKWARPVTRRQNGKTTHQ